MEDSRTFKSFIEEIEKLKKEQPEEKHEKKSDKAIQKFKEYILRITSKYDSEVEYTSSESEKRAIEQLKKELKVILEKDANLVSKLNELINDPYYPILKENANILMDIQVRDLYNLLQEIQRLNALNAQTSVVEGTLKMNGPVAEGDDDADSQRKYMKYKNKYLKLKESLL